MNDKTEPAKQHHIGLFLTSALFFVLGIAFMALLVLGYLWFGELAIGGTTAEMVLGILGAPLVTMSCYLVALASFAMSGILWRYATGRRQV